MTFNDALNQIIDDGIAAARRDYLYPEHKTKLDGAIQGLEDCRGKTPAEIQALLKTAGDDFYNSWLGDRVNAAKYWYARCRMWEIEWVANVVSHILSAQGQPPLMGATLTAGGGLKAAEIIGVKSDG